MYLPVTTSQIAVAIWLIKPEIASTPPTIEHNRTMNFQKGI